MCLACLTRLLDLGAGGSMSGEAGHQICGLLAEGLAPLIPRDVLIHPLPVRLRKDMTRDVARKKQTLQVHVCFMLFYVLATPKVISG